MEDANKELSPMITRSGPLITDELRKKLQPGNKVYVFYKEGKQANQIRHIRAIVDDEYIVYRIHSRQKGWQYHCAWYYDFQLLEQFGHLKESK